jgi:hypothetical protein
MRKAFSWKFEVVIDDEVQGRFRLLADAEDAAERMIASYPNRVALVNERGFEGAVSSFGCTTSGAAFRLVGHPRR